MINSSRVLVLAMLSKVSGWGLPSHDPLFSSNGMGGVDGARDQRQLHDSCTGITTEANSPFGAYENIQEGIAVTFPEITDLNAVPFTLDLGFGLGVQGYTGGAFDGSKFILQGISPPPNPFTANLDIEWCPNQNYFLVTVFGDTNTLVYTPSCDHSWSVSPPRACPVHCPLRSIYHTARACPQQRVL